MSIQWGDRRLKPGDQIIVNRLGGARHTQRFWAWSYGPTAARTLVTMQEESPGDWEHTPNKEFNSYYRTWGMDDVEVFTCTCQPDPECPFH